MQYWWVWLIIGVIFALSVGILVWIIVVSNKLVVLKNAVDRNFPVINSKIKQYCEKVNNLIDYIIKKDKQSANKGRSLKKEVEKCLANEGMINRAIAQKELAKKTLAYVKGEYKKEIFKGNKKILAESKELDELQLQLNNAIEKYNNCVEKYNKLRKSFPSNIIAERFKFGAKSKWNI